MNAQRMLEHYERIVDAPDAIARLRRFILDLAVRGKLVPQDPNDEFAGDFLERSTTSRSNSAGRRVSKEAIVRAVASDDLPFQIPPSWCATRLGQIAQCLDYMRRPINATEREQRVVGKSLAELFPYYGATQQQGWIDEYLFDEELVLLGEDGIPFFEPLRDKAYLISGKSWVNNHAHVFRGLHVSNRYLVHYLNVFDYSGRVVGATRSKLNQARAVDIPILLPPLSEQRRIVAKVDELMALCDRLEAARAKREATRDRMAAASLARVNTPDPDPKTFKFHARFAIQTALPALTTRPDQIKQLRQTILNLAVRGKLVAQDPNDEDASQIADRISRATGATIETNERARLYPTPPGWTWLTAEQLCQASQTITYGILKPVWVTDGVPTVRVTEMKTGRIDVSVLPKCERARAGLFSKTTLAEGDLLISKDGTIGKTAFVPPELAGGNITQHVLRFPITREVCRQFVRLVIDGPPYQALMAGETKGVALQGVNVGDFRRMLLPVAPVNEQRRIVAKVDELMSLCEQLAVSVTSGLCTRGRLLDALLHAALRSSHDNVIDLEAVRQRLLAKREAVACRSVERLAPKRGFGRVRAVKPLYFAEVHCGVPLGGQWGRADFGPFDSWIYGFESRAKSAGWFSVSEHANTDGGTRIEYVPGPALSAKARNAAQALGDQSTEFERVLALLADLNTEDSEIVATLYAAWNDLMLESKPISDEIVISEFREHWHPRKAGFEPARLRVWLDWMRKNRLVPKGQGPNTRHQPELI